MSLCIAAPSYYALRARRHPSTATWWSAARTKRDDAPDAIRTLLAGRERVELTARDAAEAIRWAQDLTGWRDGAAAPLRVWPRLSPVDEDATGSCLR